MKRFLLFLAALIAFVVLGVLPTFAQADPNIITLNDSSPAIDVVITLPADTTGTVALDFTGAAIRLTDATGAVAFSAADARIHAIELNIAPNSGSHTLTVERLPGVTEALVRVKSLVEMTTYGASDLIAGLAINPNQEVALALNADHPGDTVSVNVPDAGQGIISASFPGAGATTQLVDASGVVVVESIGGHVDGVTLLIDSGAYQFTVLGSDLTDPVVAGVRLVSAADAGVVTLQSGEAAPAVVAAAPAETAVCNAVVTINSANVHSGPGTGYTVLGYVYRDQVYPVGGRNIEDNWVVITNSRGVSAWIARDSVRLDGGCSTLTTFDIPLQDAQPVPLVIGRETGEHEEGESEDGDDD